MTDMEKAVLLDDDDVYVAPCWLGQQLIGTLFATLFGMFGGIIWHVYGGILGRTFGASMGVLATGTAGQEIDDWKLNQFVWTVVGALIVAVATEWIRLDGVAQHLVQGVCSALGASLTFNFIN